MAQHFPAIAEGTIARYFAEVWAGVSYRWSLPLGSRYGYRINPVTGQPQHHDGIDIPVGHGTGVLAVYDGRIGRIDRDAPVNGNAVFLVCGVWTFAYLHLDTVEVRTGQAITRGQQLGTVGRTGRATGYHLHFQVYCADILIDPLVFFPSNLFRAP